MNNLTEQHNFDQRNLPDTGETDARPVPDAADEHFNGAQDTAGPADSQQNVERDADRREDDLLPPERNNRDSSTPALDAVVAETGDPAESKQLGNTNSGNGTDNTGETVELVTEDTGDTVKINDVAQISDTQPGGNGAGEPPIEPGNMDSGDGPDSITGTGKSGQNKEVIEKLAELGPAEVVIDAGGSRDVNLLQPDSELITGQDGVAAAESKDTTSGSDGGREDDTPETGDEGEAPANRNPDGGAEGGGPIDGSDRPEHSDDPEDNRFEIAVMRKVVFSEVADRIERMQATERAEHADDVDQSLVYIARSFGRIARAEAGSDEPVSVTESINRSEMEQYLLPMLNVPEAEVITYYTGTQQGDGVFNERYRELLNREWLVTSRKLAEDPAYLPDEGDHLLLDAVVREFGEWVAVRPEEDYHPGQEELELLRIVEDYSAPHAGARWQTFAEYYAQMAVKTGGEQYYKDKLQETLAQLFDTSEPRQISDEFVSEVTFDAVRYTDRTDIRHLLAANYLTLIDRIGRTQEYIPDRIMLLAGEIFGDRQIPDTDKDIFVDAIKNDTDLVEIEGWGRLDPHTQLLIRMNRAAATRLGAEQPDEQTAAMTTARSAEFNRQHHELKYRILAHAGASMVTISNELSMYNSGWDMIDPINAGFANLDKNNLFNAIALDQVRYGHPDRVLSAINFISEDQMDETLVACWNLAPSIDDLQIMRPAMMTPDMQFRHLTAEIIKTNQATLVARRGEILVNGMLENIRLANLLTRPSEQLQADDQETTVQYDVSRLSDEQYRAAGLDLLQLTNALETLVVGDPTQAQELAVYALQSIIDNNIQYTNKQLEPFYDALTAIPSPRNLHPAELRLVHQAINASADNDAIKTQYLANFAYHISR